MLKSTGTLFLLAIATIVQPTNGLQCYSQTFNGTRLTEGDCVVEDCPTDDKYCVDFGGSVMLIGNVTVGFRSCEKTLAKKLQPLIEIIGKIPKIECKGDNKTEGSIGPLKFWYECCSNNLCNGSTSVTAHALMFSVTALIVLNILFAENKF